MKISYNWLNNYLALDISPEALSEILTNIGLEVENLEKFESIKGGLEGIIIGEVLTAEKHPNADKLTLTTVDIGSGQPVNIVCGAPNVGKGQKVVVATVGTTLYQDDQSLTIKKTKIRGQVSEGMICAEDEIGLGSSHEGIMVLDPSAKAGIPARDYFQVQDDYVFEIGLTPNRTDAISHIGVARDLVAGLNQLFPEKEHKLKLPSITNFHVDDTSRQIDVTVEDTEACPRYAGITISDIQITDSPDWLKNYLNAIDVRPINNVVDITNFVLFETGQPLHAFDADKIKGHVIVKKLDDKTKFITLDETERELSNDDLMICDTEEAMCIGGVFGGIHSGITSETKNIFLESAYFNPRSIRKTAKLHGLQTDASFRFERGVDPNQTVIALQRAAMLIKEIASGRISSHIVDVYPKPITNWNIDVSYKHIDRLVGKTIERSTIKHILHDLEIEVVKENNEGLKLSIPTFKADVKREADVIEEILRIYGYNNIELTNQFRSSMSFIPKPDPEKLQNLISDYLSGIGCFEMMNNSLVTPDHANASNELVAEQNVVMFNPISKDLEVLRQSLLHSGLEVIAYNQNRKATDLKLYEFGTIYQIRKPNHGHPLSKFYEERHLSLFLTGRKHPENWKNSNENVDFYLLKTYINNVLRRIGIEPEALTSGDDVSVEFELGMTYTSDNSKVAEFGKLNRAVIQQFDINQEVYYGYLRWDVVLKLIEKVKTQYHEIPKYPSVRRDLALLINQDICFGALKKLAFETEKKLLVSVNLFDVYEGKNIEPDKKSYALSFILQHPDKTLTDKVIDKTMSRLINAYKNKYNAIIR